MCKLNLQFVSHKRIWDLGTIKINSSRGNKYIHAIVFSKKTLFEIFRISKREICFISLNFALLLKFINVSK